MLCSGSRLNCFPFFNPMTESKCQVRNQFTTLSRFFLSYNGTLTYEFNSFRDRARTSICSNEKPNYPIEINVHAI